MNSAAEIVRKIKSAIRRRKILLIVTPILFLGLSIAAIYFITPKYKSSTTILIQQDNAFSSILPDRSYKRRIMKRSSARSAFNNFVKSRLTLDKLMAKLPMAAEYPKDKSKSKIIEDLRSRIKITSNSSDVMELSFSDTDPARAKKVVGFLSNHYIKTKQQLEKQQAKEAANYFSKKLHGLKRKINQQRKGIINSDSSGDRNLLADAGTLQNQLQNVNSEIGNLGWKIHQSKEKERYLQAFKNQQKNDFSVQPLYNLPLQEIPHGQELIILLKKYDTMSQNYTDSYPPMKSLEERITKQVDRVAQAIESNNKQLLHRKEDLASQRRHIADDIGNSYVAGPSSNPANPQYIAYQKLYSRIKAEKNQAVINSEINIKAARKFMIVDEAKIPGAPYSPQRNAIITVSIILGFLVGGIMIIVAEVLDTTIRTEDDLILDKPVIAYLSDEKS